MDERYAEMLRRLSFQSSRLYDFAYYGGGEESYNDSNALLLARDILSVPEVQALPAVQRVMEV